jgi:hypothetical protein
MRNLSVLAYANAFHLWHYKDTAAPLAELKQDNFFYGRRRSVGVRRYLDGERLRWLRDSCSSCWREDGGNVVSICAMMKRCGIEESGT